MMYMLCFKFGGMDDISNRGVMQSVRSSDHWANGVNECEPLGVISLVKRELQSRIAKHGTIFKLEL